MCVCVYVGGKFPVLWAPVHGWGTVICQQSWEGSAIFPKPVLESVDLLDVWLGEPRNPDGFWVAR